MEYFNPFGGFLLDFAASASHYYDVMDAMVLLNRAGILSGDQLCENVVWYDWLPRPCLRGKELEEALNKLAEGLGMHPSNSQNGKAQIDWALAVTQSSAPRWQTESSPRWGARTKVGTGFDGLIAPNGDKWGIHIAGSSNPEVFFGSPSKEVKEGVWGNVPLSLQDVEGLLALIRAYAHFEKNCTRDGLRSLKIKKAAITVNRGFNTLFLEEDVVSEC